MTSLRCHQLIAQHIPPINSPHKQLPNQLSHNNSPYRYFIILKSHTDKKFSQNRISKKIFQNFLLNLWKSFIYIDITEFVPMKKDKTIITKSYLAQLIYEAVYPQVDTREIEFVTGDIGEIGFTKYFNIEPRDVKNSFFRGEGAIVCSFLGIAPRKMKFNLLRDLSSNNLSVKEFIPCECGVLELWMFFSETKAYGDKSFYIMLSLKSNGKKYNGRTVKDNQVGHFIATNRLSSDIIGEMVVDLMAKIQWGISKLDISSSGMGSPEKDDWYYD